MKSSQTNKKPDISSAIRDRALRESEEQYRRLVETASEGIWQIDAEFRTIAVNDRMAEMLGCSKDQIVGKPIWEFVSLEDMGDARLRAANRHRGMTESYERRLQRKDGSALWVSVSATPMRDGAGRITGSFGMFTDITGRKRAEEALRQSREDLARAQEVGQIGSWRLDTRQNVLTWSHENHRIFGVPEGTALSYESFLSVVHPDDRPHVNERWLAALRGEPYDVEHRIVAGGKIKWVREKAYLEFDHAGQLLGGFGITQDITDRKLAEEALRKSEARFRLLSMTAGRLLSSDEPQAIVEQLCREVMQQLDCQAFFNFLKDESAGCLTLNACAGIDPAEAQKIRRLELGVAVCGCVARDGKRIHAQDIDQCDDPRTALVKSYGIRAYCCHPLLSEGNVIGTLSFGTATRPRFNDEEVEIMRIVADQVSTAMQRVRCAAALRLANEDLERKVQERTAQLAKRAAQLRALAGELTRSEQRERRRMAKLLHDHLQQLLVGAKFRMAILGRAGDEVVQSGCREVEQLLDESIRASRSLTAELSPPILHDGGLVPGMQWLGRWMADKHGLFVELVVEAEGIEPAEDVRILLFESVRELLFNAVKHSGARSASVNLRRVDGQVQIVVADCGDGFDPASLKPAGETGGGFGLFSIRERLDMIGGSMDIEASPGRGSRFVLTAPMGQPAPAPAADVQQPQANVRTAQLVPPKSGKIIRVMLADDHEVMREGLARLLDQEPDIEVISQAKDGQEAVERAANLLPDVILMDMSMPRLNGVEATRAIINDYPEIRVIGLSMFEGHEREQAMRDAGAVAYLTKSGPSADLIAAIRRCSNGRELLSPPASETDYKV